MSTHMENENVNKDLNKKEIREEEFDSLKAFNESFELYPNKIRPDFARTVFWGFTWNELTFSRLKASIESYKKHLSVKNWKEPMEFKTFLMEWTQWENYIEPAKEKKYASRSDALIAKIKG
jgi:hypothetical protein